MNPDNPLGMNPNNPLASKPPPAPPCQGECSVCSSPDKGRLGGVGVEFLPNGHIWMKSTLKVGLCAFGLMAATLASAEPLGRLFFTPEQRAQLEYSKPQDSGSGGSGSGRALTVNGIVQQHGGKRTAWINGVPQQAGDSDERAPESLPVAVPGLSKPVKVKVGQKVLINPAANTGQ